MDVLPYMIVVYLAFLLFLHPPRTVVIATLLGGLTMGVINALVDLLAFYAHWWHYTFKGLVLHLSLPSYATPILVYGGIVYLLTWRFWRGRGHWFALLLLIGVPIFGYLRDLSLALGQNDYLVWDSPSAYVVDLLLWPLMFYAGYFVYRRLAGVEYAALPVVQDVETPAVPEEQHNEFQAR